MDIKTKTDFSFDEITEKEIREANKKNIKEGELSKETKDLIRKLFTIVFV